MMQRTSFLFITIYSAFLELGKILMLPLATKIKAASRWNMKERCGIPPRVKTPEGRTTVWIHAASLGESKLLVKFLGILRRKNPSVSYVVTATTRTGLDYLRNTLRLDDVLSVGFLPLDTVRLMKKMLRTYAISRVWLMETELWPSMMLACIESGVPVGIANARIEEKSFASYRRMQLIFNPFFKHIDIVLAQHDAYAKRFKDLGVKPEAVHVTGNLKSMVEIGPPLPARREGFRNAMKIQDDDFIVTAGCLHAGEGRIIRETLDILKSSHFPVKCIVVPRRLDETATLIRELGPETLHIREAAAPSPWEVCIIEKFGVLEDMYAISAVSFIGGTFVSVGGHNVWDAAQFGIPVLFGPNCRTQQESCGQLLSTGTGFQVDSSQELARRILSISKIDPNAFASAFSLLTGATRRREERIQEIIP